MSRKTDLVEKQIVQDAVEHAKAEAVTVRPSVRMKHMFFFKVLRANLTGRFVQRRDSRKHVALSASQLHIDSRAGTGVVFTVGQTTHVDMLELMTAALVAAAPPEQDTLLSAPH